MSERGQKEVEGMEELSNTAKDAVEGNHGAEEEKEKTAVDDAQEEEEKAVEKEEEISYNYSELRSGAERVNISEDTYLELHHSFGYECQKRNNLVVLDKTTVAFSAGNHTELLDLVTMEQQCLRSLGGGGIGALAVHPSRKWLAVGEKGTQPVIAIFSFPELQLHRILRGGTEEMYSHMNFSSGEGEMLASVGGYPDFMLTVWDWKKESIVLRCKAFSQDVFRVSFSPDNPGQLTTSGTGHIRFWKMATTFTGLKLQGQLGKFGRTELSDIAAYVELPDGKVLSGTEWGNLLLWDGGFIKVEISRKNHKLCHQGMIEALFLDDGELISAGVDGYIRVWDFETIDNADITDENITFEMDPLTEIRVGHDVSLKTLARSVDPDTPTIWYAQDSAGAIWRVDITSAYTREPPEKLVSYHSGPVCGVCCSPAGHQAASIGHDGSVRVYDLDSRELLCHTHFSGGGASLVWTPPTVETQSTILLAGFRDGVLRVLNVEQSKKREGGYQLTLKHACKPHSQPLTCLSVHPQGNILATGSADNTVFFLHMTEQYRPIGFITTPSSVTSLHWTSEKEEEEDEKGGGLLVSCCEDGSIVETTYPLDIEHDISKTFHLKPLPCHIRKFSSIKDRLRTEEEDIRQAAERERKRREKEAAKQRKREEMGDDYVSEEEKEEEEEEVEGEGEEEEDEEEEKPKGPSPILSALVTSSEREFWVSMGGYDAGYIYQMSMEGAGAESELYEAKNSLPIPSYDGRDLPLHSMVMSSLGGCLLTGSSNGVIRIHPLSSSLSPSSSLSSYWSLTVHDNQHGAITHLSTTYDDSYVVSGGSDGNIFVFSAHLPAPSPQTPEPSSILPLEVHPPSKPAKDIDDPNYYSIEDAKQKAEHDRQLKQAEMKKHSVRKEIGRLRRTFLQLVQQNQDLPLPLQLAADEFIMDPSLEAGMRERAQHQVELVKREMAWDTEKHCIALDKLEKWFKAVVECERLVVWSFSKDHSVSSYRTPQPSAHFLDQLKIELSSILLTTPGTVATIDRGRTGGGMEEEEEEERDATAEREVGEGDEFEKISKQEARRLRRERRKREWEELMARRPGRGEEDPEEAAIVEQFRANMGDYRLKTASDYVVPKHQRVTFSKKRQSLLLLRDQIFQRKRDYNHKLLSLRDKKKSVLEKAMKLRRELETVQDQLPHSLHLPIPSFPAGLRLDEQPEKKQSYTKKSLLKFAAEKEERERLEREAAAGVGEGFGGFGGFGGGGGGDGGDGDEEGEDGEKVDEEEERKEDEEQLDEMGENDEQSKTDVEENDGEWEKEQEEEEEEEGEEKEIPVQQSELGVLVQQERQVQLLFQQKTLIQEMEEMKTTFDEALFRLHHEKTVLDCSTITASLRHITQYQELTLLRESEKKEKTFTSRYHTKKTESREVEAKIQGLSSRLKQLEKKLSQLHEQEKSLTNQFLERVGEGNKFRDFLLKVFRKKIKRTKMRDEGKKTGEGEEDEDEEEDSEDDESDISSSEEESESGEGTLDDSVCPAGCDPSLFSLACSLRDTRLDLEDALTEEKRATDQTRKELESSKKKLKTMESHVKTAQNDLEAFQLKKQQKLNELDRVVVLRLDQILHHSGDGEPPSSISSCLVFPEHTLADLSLRISAVKEERKREKLRFKELHQQHVKLVRERREMEGKVKEWKEKLEQTMTLKFGRVIDLDSLGAVTANRAVDDMRAKLRTQEEEHGRELAVLQGRVERSKRQLVGVVRENTQQILKLSDLLTTQQSLESRLNARHKSLRREVGGGGGGGEEDEEEMERLQQLTVLQAQEIAALQHEIKVLSLKGGKILPPSQPPVGPPPPGVVPPII